MQRHSDRLLTSLMRSDGPAMAAEPTDKPEQRASAAVLFLDDGDAATVRTRGQRRSQLDHVSRQWTLANSGIGLTGVP
jgi:hypothetical protein